MSANNTDGESPSEVLRGIADLLKLAGAASAVLIPVILPDGLIPYQLSAVAVGASLLALVGFLVGITFRDTLKKYRRSVVSLALGSSLLVVALNTGLVIRLDSVGSPPQDMHLLVGTSLSETGRQMVKTAGVEKASREQQVARVGFDQIPRLYGNSYRIAAFVYTAAILIAFFSIVVTLVAVAGSSPASDPYPKELDFDVP